MKNRGDQRRALVAPQIAPQYFKVDRCPQCGIAKPNLEQVVNAQSSDWQGQNPRMWVLYQCHSCGRMVTVSYAVPSFSITDIYPQPKSVDKAVPERARDYLEQAISSVHAPAGAIMLAASAVDAMLKEKKYENGSLDARIRQAAADHVITLEMAEWAHEIRLEANAQRHADIADPLPTTTDAERAIQFCQALAQFLFVLPNMVAAGRGKATP